MKNRLLSAASAAALSLSLLGGAVFAEDLGLKQLQDSATTALAQLNMDTSMIDVLTLEELGRIQGVASSTVAENNKVQQIETILRDADERIAEGGAVVPAGTVGDVTSEEMMGDQVIAASVGQYLAQLGVADQFKVENLTTDQLLQVQLVQGSKDSMSEQRTRVEELLSN